MIAAASESLPACVSSSMREGSGFGLLSGVTTEESNHAHRETAHVGSQPWKFEQVGRKK